MWSQTDGRGEPLAAGRAADAFLLAAGLQPEASWASWARGSAGYYFQRERRFHDALVQYNKAITLSPGHSLRPIWEVGLGICLLETYRLEEGMEQLIDTLGSLGSDYGELTFAGRRAVAHALWVSGDFVHAASVVDLLLEDSPSFARSSKYDARWARMYLDAGRSSAAMPFLERLEKEGVSKAQRERARWWLHEVALAHRDSSQARRWLRKILDQTPGSVLVPLAESRLRVLESVEVGGVGRGMSWQSVTMDLRNRALDWPFTPVEDEALSLSAQLFIELGLIEEALSLYSWVEERTPSEGGAIAYEHVVCKLAPRTFSELRSRGEITRALGVYRSFLDEPRMYSCIDVSTRAEASSAALAAGLPDLATRWLGQAVAQDTVQTDAARNLVQLADIYLREGEVQSAEQTLVYLETVDLKIAAGVLDSAWGDVLAAQGEYAEAEARYSKALVLAADYVRTRGLIPSLYYRRGLVREELGEFDGALEDMAFGLENGGADDPAVGWYRFVAIASGMASSKEDFEEILVACDSAEAAASEDDDFRGLRWYRSLALRDLGRLREAATILDELSLGSDSWALRAAELRSSDDFALLRTGQQVDGAVSER